MVLERLIDDPRIKNHFSYILFLSFAYVFVAYIIAYLFFREQMSLAAVFTLTILLIPSLNHIISSEEQIERKEGLKHFFRNHKSVFKIYGLAFLGVLLGFFAIGTMSGSDLIYAYQINFLNQQHSIGVGAVSSFANSDYSPKAVDVLGLFSQNLEVLLICFALSVFYGAGAVFLVVFNASLFSAFLSYFMNTTTKYVASISFIHFIPEIFGFLLAGIAGAVLSVAILNESFSSPYFKNVMKNICLLFVLAIALVLVSAVLEIFVSGALIHSLVSS